MTSLVTAAGTPLPSEIPQDPSTLDAGAVVAALGTDAERGLGSDEAAARLAHGGPNRLAAQEPVPAWRRLAAQFADPLIYLLLASIVVSLIAWLLEGAHGLPIEAIVIALIVVGNGVLGFLQERQAEQAVGALQRAAAPLTTVVRDGEERRVAAEEVVPGDVLVVGEGDAVSADGRLLRASSLMVAEAALTGESEAVLKGVETLKEPAPLGERVNMLFSGTAVARGRGRAVVTATGMATEIGHVELRKFASRLASRGAMQALR